MKKRFIALLLAVCLVCSFSTIASAAESSTMVTYDLVTHTRTETQLNNPSMFSSQEVSSDPVQGTGDFGPLLAEGVVELAEDGIFPKIDTYAYDDNWTRVSSPTSFPYCAIAFLKIYFPSGTQTGTGFVLASGKVVTAAHCLYNLHDGHVGETPTSITVYFGWNNQNSVQSVTAQASAFHVNSKWDSNLDANYDYGVIDINSSITSVTRKFTYSKTVNANTKYTLTGIPYDKKVYFGNYMYTDTGKVDSWDDRTIQHSLNCCGGISGAPLYDSDNKVVGLHTWSTDEYGTATRITNDLISMLS